MIGMDTTEWKLPPAAYSSDSEDDKVLVGVKSKRGLRSKARSRDVTRGEHDDDHAERDGEGEDGAIVTWQSVSTLDRTAVRVGGEMVHESTRLRTRAVADGRPVLSVCCDILESYSAKRVTVGSHADEYFACRRVRP